MQDLRGCMRTCSGLGRTPEGSTAGLAQHFFVGASCFIADERAGAGIRLLAPMPVSSIICTSELLDWAALGRVSSSWGVWGCLAASAASNWSTGAGAPSFQSDTPEGPLSSFVRGEDCLAELSKSLAHQVCVKVESAVWQP